MPTGIRPSWEPHWRCGSMNTMRRISTLTLFLIACSGPASQSPAPPAPPSVAAEAPAIPLDPDLIADRANLTEQLTPYVASYGRQWGDAYKFSGFVLVAQRGQTVYQQGFGFADWSDKVGNTADTSFRTGSITKQFTAAAILVLEQQGKLSVSDPVARHIPDFPAPGADVTIHQLLTHTSGLPSYTSFPEVMETREKARTVQQMLELFWDKPLDFEPGSRFRYSNSGYIVLGAIIERASGQTYGEFLETHLFQPAGLENTVYGDADGARDRALAYDSADGELQPAHAIDMSVPYAAGGIRSTAHDLVEWHQALAGERILSAASKAKLYRPDKEKYAYGWVVHEIAGHPVIEHGGGIDGFTTAYIRVMDADMVIVVWSNNALNATKPVAENAVRASFGATLEPIEEAGPSALDPEIARKLPGSYQLTEPSLKKLSTLGAPDDLIAAIKAVEITANSQSLTLAPKGMPSVTLAPTGKTTFVDKAHGVDLEFTLSADGAVEAMTLRQNGLELAYVPGT